MVPGLSIDSRLALHGGTSIPQYGFGVYLSRSPQASVLTALTKTHVRHVDSAAMYKNESAVGDAVRASGLARSDVFITTKIHFLPKDGEVLDTLRKGVARFGFDYVDLFLIHEPSIGHDARLALWRGLLSLQKEGRARAIGVSNFNVRHLEELKRDSDVFPAVNQIEVHPWCQERDVVEYCRRENIVIEAYCPLAQGHYWDDDTLQRIARAHGRDAAQILIRWSLQKGFVCLPKSDTPSRIVSNADVWEFQLSEQDMADLDNLDRGDRGRVCWNVIRSQ